MDKFLFCLLYLFFSYTLIAQVSSSYVISFENAVHHEAFITATFRNLEADDVEFTMSRSSPGRYALHEFIKNVYSVKVTDGEGNELKVTRPNPYSWKVKNHDGTINVRYTLFANMGDGTYSQIDKTHAHLNIPATFIYMPSLENKGIEVTFNVREDLNWKVATQLKHLDGNTYYAKNFQYFMDSPTEISNYSTRSFDVDEQTINFVLHHNGTEAELDAYFEKIKKIVLQEKAVFGELPKYDYGTYSFLVCYMPNVSSDAMEHRNSTFITTKTNLNDGGLDDDLSSFSHEFFHCWNVERIRPKSLEPFDFQKTNMSGELWFAEGFTEYYGNLSLCRASLTTKEDYIKGLVGGFNYVWNSSGLQFFNPIEMSYQAPFVDAARSVDPVNRGNTFITYYYYGEMLGLALDLSLREKGLNLDDFMKLMWTNFGRQEKPYTIKGLHNTLNSYAGADFGNYFFNHYIYKSEKPDMEHLLNNVGVSLTQDTSNVSFGANVRNGFIYNYPTMNSSAYNAGLDYGDKIIKIGDTILTNTTDFNSLLEAYKPNDTVTIVFQRLGITRETTLTFLANNSYNLNLFETNNLKLDKKAKALREAWLQSK